MSRLILKICISKFKSLPRDENGAAMMITLAVVLFLYLLCSSTYAIGMTVNEKIQLQNAADAAAYSAAVVEADGLSRIATINRAMSWTYIQTVKRRMDYITLRWLQLTLRRFNEDYNTCRTFNNSPYRMGSWGGRVWHVSRHCSSHVSTTPREGCWWVGWTPSDGVSGNPMIRLGGITREDTTGLDTQNFLYGRLHPHQAVQQYVQNVSASDLESAIRSDDQVLGALYGLLQSRIAQLGEQVENTALNVLKKNFPHKTIGGDEYFYDLECRYFNNPYLDTQLGNDTAVFKGVLSAVKNTEEDELEFLAASTGASDSYSIWGDGIDQWFVRGRDVTFDSDDLRILPSIDDYAMRGIQRGYKSANREEGVRAAGIARGKHVAYGGSINIIDIVNYWNGFSQLLADGFITGALTAYSDFFASYSTAQNAPTTDNIPSNMNFNTLFVEQCANNSIRNNFGLLSEYHYGALRWWCGTKWRLGAFGIPRRVGARCFKISSIATCSAHGSQTNGHARRSNYCSCFIGKDMISQISETHGANNHLAGYMTMGYSRIYGDDQTIYNKGIDGTDYTYYYTPKIMPVKLNHRFFQERINVAVGKKQKNPLYWLFSSNNNQRTVATEDSIFALFNPTLFSGNNSNSMIVATSSATAAFRSRRNGGGGHYETNFDQISAFEYNDKFDSDTPTIRLSSRANLAYNADWEKLRIGCPHIISTNNINQRMANVWNLCETDWQAVFVPHRYADKNWIGHQRKDGGFVPYDSVRSSSDVWYRPYPQELSINSNFLISLGFPNEKGEYLKPLYDTSKGNGRLNVRHPAFGNEPPQDFSSEDLALFLLKFKLQ